jgi:hypothetical protein
MYITNDCLGDGFGSQYQYLLELILMCYKNGYNFVYTPLHKIEHNYNNDPDFYNKMEYLMNIKSSFQNINNVSNETKSNIIIAQQGNVKSDFDKNISHFVHEEYIEKIRCMFWENKQDRKNPFNNGKINIAVHFRRYNTFDDKHYDRNHYNGRFDGKEYFMKVMNKIRNTYKNQSIQFHLYTQKNVLEYYHEESKDNIEDYFKADDVEFHIDTNICDSFIEMVAADILVTSASSLSYSAGLLNKGIVYYRPFWHKPLRHWIVVNKDND